MRKNFLQKFLLCFLVGLDAGLAAGRIISRFTVGDDPRRPLMFMVVGIPIFLGFLIYSIVWYLRDNKKNSDSVSVLAFLQGCLRYTIAIDLATIGWQKIFKLQFIIVHAKLDNPFSSFNGEDLTWAYFHYSYPFACIIGGCQVIGSLLLLFKKTRLFATIFLMPVVINIFLIDVFYQLSPGVVLQITVVLTGLIYLLLQDYSRLKEFFFLAKDQLPQLHFRKPVIKNMIRFSVIYLPLILICFTKPFDRYPELTGRYRVENITINNKKLFVHSIADSIPTIVYFDVVHDIAMEFNNHKRIIIGEYDYERASGKFNAGWNKYNPGKTNNLTGKLTKPDQMRIKIEGKLGTENWTMNLVKDDNSEYDLFKR